MYFFVHLLIELPRADDVVLSPLTSSTIINQYDTLSASASSLVIAADVCRLVQKRIECSWI
jgi:hypothetical protein